jgi:hypothetical protein
MRRPANRHPSPPGAESDFEEFQATELFCPRCRAARPVREFLLLVLPDGDLHEYRCAACGTSVGQRKVQTAPRPLLIS